MKSQVIKVDLHVHSKFSSKPSSWVLRKIGCPESYTDPLEVYQIAKRRGMSFVTITDHDTIDGCLAIDHLPDTFISEEVTTCFPGKKSICLSDAGRCKVDVLVLDINEDQHKEIQRLRENIYDLVSYLNKERIVYILAHPFYNVNGRLTVDHFEKLLLLFKSFEQNGTRDEAENRILRQILSNLTVEDIERLSEKHKIIPLFSDPWRKNLIGGSDDHSSLNIACKYTQIENVNTLAKFLEGLENGKAEVVGRSATALTIARNFYSVAYQHYKASLKLQSHTDKDLFLKILERFLRSSHDEDNIRPHGWVSSKIYGLLRRLRYFRDNDDAPDAIQDLLRHELQKMIMKDPYFVRLMDGVNGSDGLDQIFTCNMQKNLDKEWFQFANRVSNNVIFHLGNRFFDNFSRGNFFEMFNAVGSCGAVYFLLAPYIVAFSFFTKDRQLTRRISDRFIRPASAPQQAETCLRLPTAGQQTDAVQREGCDRETIRVAYFSDTFYEVNGVAITLQQQIKTALRLNKDLTMIICSAKNRSGQQGVRNFKPVGSYNLPEYSEMKLCYPPFLEMLNFCEQKNFTCIHSSTPGPIGLAALMISHILKTPIRGTYHTLLPQYTRYLTNDNFMEQVMWKYVIWYYDQMDCVYVPSESTGTELIERGISSDKIRMFPRGVDIDLFHPSMKNGSLDDRHNVKGKIKLLYVGRISKEKNLHILCESFRALVKKDNNVSLFVVGDGPYLKEMQESMRKTPCIFRGYLEGNELASVYASCDLFVFPSTTDTFGNVVLEAQASGIPVIITDTGGPRENIIPEKTGLIVKGGSTQGLLEAIESLVFMTDRRKEMGRAARKYMEGRSFEKAFIQYWEMYQK